MPTWSLSIDVEGLPKFDEVYDKLSLITSGQASLAGASEKAYAALMAQADSTLRLGSVYSQATAHGEEFKNQIAELAYYSDQERTKFTQDMNQRYEEIALRDEYNGAIQVTTGNIEAETIAIDLLYENRIRENQQLGTTMDLLEDHNEAQKQRSIGTWEQVADIDFLIEKNKELEIQERENIKAIRERDRALVNMSISLFVGSIVMTQWASVGKSLFKDNKEIAKSFDMLKSAIMATMLPMQTLTALTQLNNQIFKNWSLTIKATMASFAGLWFLFMAFQQKSPVVRAAMIGIGTALTMVGAAAWLSSTGMAGLSAFIGRYDVIAATAVGAAILAGVMGSISSMPKGQTIPGQYRNVLESGGVYLHRGEKIVRPGAISSVMDNSQSSLSVQVNVESGATVDDRMIDKMIRAIENKLSAGSYTPATASRRRAIG